ncbi:MAG: FtsL-like putative cell division protein [Dysgonamonadaceae bacterium]|jgi:cell division protein FtsL|nr:FtsL-like putative cell division protein [Dysgonamonadaceae bacterium]MDD3357083.1 FtsL-like putative cell division protein [Dysgonamonadaceae bacterium]MDD3728612.1 FtsL-like putative cell division protein [Dysgonamonadaceae bacterium]MDD4605581.1 FtsL-like putative cell division protein [Dysgonamonadaceae bacterium]HUI33880.1 FtsL-like putative cell division protein [Dysgonamonadaceae bacterium]
MKFNKIRKSFVRVFGGNILTENFIINNMRFFVVLIIIIFVFISHRYTYLQKMSEIENLQRELKDAKYESLTISSNLTQASRQTEIEKLIVQYGLDIKISNEPIYYIKK